MKVWVDGRRSALIDVSDRGLQYGDGVFETMAVRAGTVRLLQFHLQRLSHGCARLKIAAPARALLRAEIQAAASGQGHAVLKLIVTRGSGARGYAARELTGTRRILFCDASPAYAATARDAGPRHAVRLRICRTRLAANPLLAGIKSLNRLESVLARNEWRGSQFADGLMLDADDHIVCGTMSNVFLRHGKKLATPKLDRCGVCGVMRRWVIQTAPRLGFPVRQSRLSMADLRGADEIFITNALMGVVSVERIAGVAWRMRENCAAAALSSQLSVL